MYNAELWSVFKNFHNSLYGNVPNTDSCHFSCQKMWNVTVLPCFSSTSPQGRQVTLTFLDRPYKVQYTGVGHTIIYLPHNMRQCHLHIHFGIHSVKMPRLNHSAIFLDHFWSRETSDLDLAGELAQGTSQIYRPINYMFITGCIANPFAYSLLHSYCTHSENMQLKNCAITPS